MAFGHEIKLFANDGHTQGASERAGLLARVCAIAAGFELDRIELLVDRELTHITIVCVAQDGERLMTALEADDFGMYAGGDDYAILVI